MIRIVIVEISIRLYSCGSLKEKRSTRNKLVDRLRKRFHLSIQETQDQDILNLIHLTAAYVALNQTAAEHFISALEEQVHSIVSIEGESSIESEII